MMYIVQQHQAAARACFRYRAKYTVLCNNRMGQTLGQLLLSNAIEQTHMTACLLLVGMLESRGAGGEYTGLPDLLA